MGSCRELVFKGLLLLFIFVHVRGQINMLCMMEHCALQSRTCMADHHCRTLLMCMTGCGNTNQTCMFRCLYSYEDQKFDDFMKCAYTDHKCLQMKSPNPGFRCSIPSNTLRNLPASQLLGSWYIVKGLNPNFDCFDCQITTFTQTSQPNIFNVTEKFNVVSIAGNVIQRQVTETATQNATLGGILSYKSLQMGHQTTTNWQILYADQTFMIGYYCGHVSTDWYYEGVNVFSRSSKFDEKDGTFVKEKMKTFGLDYSKLCSPRTSNCS